ncbi:MAG: Na/Pi cotransporter family protein [Clostridia bacterium]|nr:Na/Pi cotransporter family protein [Clostridia bacterium]
MSTIVLSVITLLGGLAFFLYGMSTMSNGLEKVAGGKFEIMLKKATSRPVKGMLLGMLITIAIQSSSAMTVMLVGLVNSGIMQMGQTIGVIMGSNIGTTLTPWILSLSGIESGNLALQLLKPANFAPLFAFIGILLTMVAKSERKKDVGKILIGFAVLMFGMELMGDSVSGLEDNEQFKSILTAFTNPILGVLVGAIFTGIIQSSAASVGILQTLAGSGLITYSVAIPIIMGQNIGTCVTALISSIGVNKNARRVSVVHISFNLIGTFVCLVVYLIADSLVDFTFSELPIDAVGIALVHTIFNIVTTLMLFPFTKQLEKMAHFFVRSGEDGAEVTEMIDERLLKSPSIAIAECRNLTCEMAKIAEDTFCSAADLITSYDEALAEKIIKLEDKLDMYEDKLGTYLIKLSGCDLTDANSKEVSIMQHCIGNIERIGDHAVNIVYIAREMQEKGIVFSEEGAKAKAVVVAAIKEILQNTMQSLCDDNVTLAKLVEPLEQVIDRIIEQARDKHLDRLEAGKCTIKDGFVYNDILSDFERVSDHCSNIAVCVIRAESFDFETHEYLSDMKKPGHADYEAAYNMYLEKYKIA